MSRERVRQLQEKALRRLKPGKALETLVVISACRTLQVNPTILLSGAADCDASDAAAAVTVEEHSGKL